MMAGLFCSLDSAGIAEAVKTATYSVCYAAPGIQDEAAAALAEVARRIGPQLISVCLDFDERVMRMGFGSLEAVQTLRRAGITVRTTPGLRTGLVIVDDGGYIFTPTARYLEPDHRSDGAPNALRLSRAQAKEALARLSPAAKDIAMEFAQTPEEREAIRSQAVEVPSTIVGDAELATVAENLAQAPPVQFDIARRVRVFESYLQYVEVTLKGTAIQRRRIRVPRSIQNLGAAEGIHNRLRTTFDLVEGNSGLSSKALEDELSRIRDAFTPSLGKPHGRVLLKTQKPLFEKRLEQLREKLKAFQKEVETSLQEHLNATRDEIVDYYVPRVLENPPDAFAGKLLTSTPTREAAEEWLRAEMGRVIPKAENLVKKMVLDQTYKDVTFETLNKPEFLKQLQKKFPAVNWDKAYEEFLAAGQKSPG